MNIDTAESRKRARALLLLGLDALDAFDREQKWADDRGRFSQEIADRRRTEARVRGEELATRFNRLKRQYQTPGSYYTEYKTYGWKDLCKPEIIAFPPLTEAWSKQDGRKNQE